MVQTVAELTNNEYNELAYSAARPIITGPFVRQICILLGQCDFDVELTDQYDQTVEQAVRDFQSAFGLTANGILDDKTLQAMIYCKDKLSDIVFDESIQDYVAPDAQETGSPHYDSFFHNDRFKQHRQNQKDIKIVFGSANIVKTIKDVYMRSVSVEVDTSGNPIAEIYEFIARDITESDELSDISKYDGIDDLASSDVQGYDFSSVLS